MAALNAVAAASSWKQKKKRTKRVLAAWGTFHAIEKAAKFKNSMPKQMRTAFKSRKGATEWSKSQAARELVDAKEIKPSDWFTEIAKYDFLLAPLGNGIQSSKIVEALLVQTIPIIQRGPYPVFDDMFRMGFPIVLVDKWEEINSEMLEAWWCLLAPRLDQFLQACVTSAGYWSLVTAGVNDCMWQASEFTDKSNACIVSQG